VAAEDGVCEVDPSRTAQLPMVSSNEDVRNQFTKLVNFSNSWINISSSRKTIYSM